MVIVVVVVGSDPSSGFFCGFLSARALGLSLPVSVLAEELIRANTNCDSLSLSLAFSLTLYHSTTGETTCYWLMAELERAGELSSGRTRGRDRERFLIGLLLTDLICFDLL